ncbi:MAG: transcription-repair coupling factor [Eubacteriales bacterium]|nr:transcription-repair coupling factor [Eubacteriales bacterium]
MKRHPLIEQMAKSPEIADLTHFLLAKNSSKRANLAGFSEAAEAPLALAIAEAIEDLSGAKELPPVLLFPDELSARRLRVDLESLAGFKCLEIQAVDPDITPAAARSRLDELELIANLADLATGDYGAIIVTADALGDNLPAPERFANNYLEFTVGGEFVIEKLCEQLLELGYEASPEVDAPAQFSWRGDIVDISVPRRFGELSIYRLSFFDTEIDDIRLVDPDTQRSISSLPKVQVGPARLLYLSEAERLLLAEKIPEAVREFKKQYLANGGRPEDLKRLEAEVENDLVALNKGDYQPGLLRWLPLLNLAKHSILDYTRELGLPLFVFDLARLRERLDQAQANWLLELKVGIEDLRFLPSVAELRPEVPEILKGINSYSDFAPLLSLSQLSASSGFVGAEKFKLTIRTGESYRQRFSELRSELENLGKNGVHTYLFAGKAEVADKLNTEFISLKNLTVVPEFLARGFYWPKAGLNVIGTDDLFAKERSRRKKEQRGTPIRYFTDLAEGDLLVHEDHGIGRFIGLKTLDTSTGRKDYIEIEYAKEDKLFLPLEALNKIQKYLGGGEEQVRLSRLGGSEWERQKTRARESIKKLAFDLVELYAKRRAIKGHKFPPDGSFEVEFANRFPYIETPDQVLAMSEIRADMESDKVMDRLLCGDVGFGKTELAFRALFKAVVDGQQAAFLAPTTVLAQQHYQNFVERCEGFPLRIELLSRLVPLKKRREILAAVARGEVDVLIGTHSLLNKDLTFDRLKLLVVDEEQRFGVGHKESLKERYPDIDVLSLSATPIPRTLHMSLAGIRDISILERGPEDRRPVRTYVMEYDFALVSEAILQELARGGQIFYLINNVKAVEKKALELAEAMPGLRVKYAHGQMPERALEEVIMEFVEGKFDLLVCTTIIENGIDLPNVNTMIVEDAERLGLSQLYQIRGRVGRSGRQAYAYITYRPERILTEIAEKRLATIRDFTELGSGFKIALRDLEVRGAGNILGGEQHGQMAQIGYELYCRMLDEEIAALRGEQQISKAPDEIEVKLDFKIDALIPQAYIRDSVQRMAIYRRCLKIADSQELTDLYDELLDRFGEPPRQVENLLDLAYLRGRAKHLKITEIRRLVEEVRLNLVTDENLPMAAISAVLAVGERNGSMYLSAVGKPQMVLRRSFASDREALTALNQLFKAAEQVEDKSIV